MTDMSIPEPLIFVPGLLCDGAVWQQQAAALGEGRRVHVAAHELANDLNVMAQRILAAGPERFALVGHSMGGRVALEVLARAPERVTRVALLDTGFQALPQGEAGERERAGRYRLLDIARREGMLAMGKEWTRGMVHPDRLADAPLMDAIHQMIARAPVAQFEAQIHALLTRADRTALLAEIRVPTLVLCGREDSWSPLQQHEEMAQRIRGSQLVVVPHCGHMSTMEQPAAITQALAQWLAA
jgi:pimeloyl-ACP methyl ester carboxylesterase